MYCGKVKRKKGMFAIVQSLKTVHHRCLDQGGSTLSSISSSVADLFKSRVATTRCAKCTRVVITLKQPVKILQGLGLLVKSYKTMQLGSIWSDIKKKKKNILQLILG